MVRDLQCCYLNIILQIEGFLISMILCITQMMQYPPFVDGLDKDVAHQILQSQLARFIEVRDHFQNNPVLLLCCSGSAYTPGRTYFTGKCRSTVQLPAMGQKWAEMRCIPVTSSDGKYSLNF